MNSLLLSLTPVERDLLTQALQISAAREKGEEAPAVPSPPRPKRRVTEEAFLRIMERAHRENDAWDSIEQSLELPFVYRTEAHKALSLKMLRSIPMLQLFSDDDLVVLCKRMEIVRLKGREIILVKPQESAPVTSGNKSESLHVSFLLRGSAILRLPLVSSGVERYPIEQYDPIGIPVTFTALPYGARYECDVECVLLRFPLDTDIALDRVIGQIERQIVDAQVTFLRQHLRARILAHWTSGQYIACARALVPLRVPGRQIVVEQGARSDALFFIREGHCVVARSIPLQPHEPRPQPVSLPVTVSPVSRTDGTPTQLLEVGTLREGEFFGELALLNHNADWEPDVDTVWSRTHWVDTLDRALRAPVDYSALEDNAWPVPQGGNERTNATSGLFPPIPLPRQATVYTALPCVLYMLSFDHCRQFFDSGAFTQLKEFSKGYPSRDVLGEKYMRRHKWTQYRKGLLEGLAVSNGVLRKREKLPPLQFH